MASPGLSLFGFLDEPAALAYLRTMCVLKDGSPAALRERWQEARQRLGPPIRGAGQPEILDLPSGHASYLEQVRNMSGFNGPPPGSSWSFRLVEIDPLLAFQYHVRLERVASLCTPLNGRDRFDELLKICLPTQHEPLPCRTVNKANGILIASESTNLRILKSGLFGPAQNLAGVCYGPSLPLVRVVRFEGRCYLSNGFHRAHGLRRAGITHLPCLFVEATHPSEICVRDEGESFSFAALRSDNPPTCAYLTEQRAYPVRLRDRTQVISITWLQYALPDE